MSNVIQFPMDRVRLSPTADDFFHDKILTQAFDLEQESLQMLAQAKAIEEQSQRVLEYLSNLEN